MSDNISPRGSTLSGTWFVSPTPFTTDGAVDGAGLAGIVEATADWGVDGITVLGVMGEVSALGDSERDEVLTAVLSAAKGMVPVAVGCSSPSAVLTAQRISRAVSLGASAVMVSAPTLLKAPTRSAASTAPPVRAPMYR